jgi:Bacterial archaeo-eukaryotic release factor family 10
MLTRAQLVTLHRSFRNERVLTVYIQGSATDPARQRAWRVELDHNLDDLREWDADSSHDEREQLERCIRLLEEELAALAGGIGTSGWVAFIVAGRLREAHHLLTPVPTLAVWGMGLCIAPYMRALKETRPVVVAVADGRKVRLHLYCVGQLDRVETVRAHHVIDRPSHMGTPPMQGFHTGTHGSAGRDTAQRSLLAGRDRMLAEASEGIQRLAGSDGWIVLGGIPRVIARLAHQLSAVAPRRLLELATLDVHASEAQIAEAARSGASALRNAADARRLAEIVDLAEAGGPGAIGVAATEKALEQSCVHELYLTHRYLEDFPPEAEDAVRAALDQDALVEEVSGEAAGWLDEQGGVAAHLRYRVADRDGAFEEAGRA